MTDQTIQKRLKEEIKSIGPIAVYYYDEEADTDFCECPICDTELILKYEDEDMTWKEVAIEILDQAFRMFVALLIASALTVGVIYLLLKIL